jgi:iron complex outermembrane receptor protein
MLWISVSRAIRQPNRVDFGARLNLGVAAIGGLPTVLTLFGNSTVKTERMFDYEAGYRSQIHRRLSLDLATFLSYYRDLQTSEPGIPSLVATPGTAPYLVLPVTFGNLARGRNYGAELFIQWTPVRRWTLSPGYSFLQTSVQPDAGSLDTIIGASSGYSAKHHLQVASVLKLPWNLEWNAALRYVSRLATPNIASYAEADTTLRWRPRDNLEVSVTGQNLLSPRHMEFGDLQKILLPSTVQRGASVKLAWRF